MDATLILPACAGGALIGLAAAALLLLDGRIAGISGIVAGLLTPRSGDTAWRALFVAGLIAGGALLPALTADPFDGLADTAPARLVAAGLLVGFGTRLGSGCTSGHGVCGIGRMAPRSLVATATFMATGALTVFLVRHVLAVTP
jgi:uncharacterized protein